MDPIQFMKQYALWREEAQAELESYITKHGNQGRQWSFREDGTIVGEMLYGGGRENRFMRAYPKFKVTAWKDSKHYYKL